MERKQVDLPFPNPFPWKKMEPDLKTQTIRIIARMIGKSMENRREEADNEKKAEP